jgi:hypothetical protein
MLITTALTPLQQVANFLVKRDDLFEIAGVRGGSRSSPQANIVGHVAKALGIPCRVHVPEGELGSELVAAQAAGAVVKQHSPGHNSVINRRARDDASARGWQLIPFGMECAEAVQQTAAQARSTKELCRTNDEGPPIAERPPLKGRPRAKGFTWGGVPGP